MAVRGTNAKLLVEQRIKQAFGQDWIGNIDKKLFVWADDGGEKVQIAINLTCPKTNVGDTPVGAFDTGTNIPVAPTLFQPAEITDEEKQNIADMMERLGL